MLVYRINSLLPCVFDFQNSTANSQAKLILEEVAALHEQLRNEATNKEKTEQRPKIHLQITPKKNPICIPPLNLRLRNQPNNLQRKIELSSRKRNTHNENLNEETRSIAKQTQPKSKILDGKNMTNQMKIKKSINNSKQLGSPQKRKGKTVEKKGQSTY